MNVNVTSCINISSSNEISGGAASLHYELAWLPDRKKGRKSRQYLHLVAHGVGEYVQKE